jgi:hypothetical protein
MRLYFNGLENTSHRETLRRAGVEYACLSFSYLLRYKSKIEWEEEFSFLDGFIIRAGTKPNFVGEEEFIDKYLEFISEYQEDNMDFAMEVPEKYWDELPVPCAQFVEETCGPFYGDIVAINSKFFDKFQSNANIYDLNECGFHVHGIGFYELPRFDLWQQLLSANFSHWLYGKFGQTYRWRNEKLEVYYPGEEIVRRKIAEELNNEGYDIDADKIKKKEWREVNYMNAIAFQRYTSWMNS